VTALLPTLTGVVANAPIASADPPAEHEWWNEFNGFGLTKVDMRFDVSGDYWKSFAIVHPQQHSACDSGTNMANQANEAADLGGALQTTFVSGGTGNFCIEVNEGWAGTSTSHADYYTSVTFKIRNENGTVLPGSYVMNNPGGWHQQQSPTITVQMDAEPFDGAADAALAPGWYEMILELRTQNECTPDPCTSLGEGNTYHYGRGYFYVGQGYLWGAHPDGNSTSELTQEQANTSTGLAKNMSLVRDYKSDWNPPSSRVATWASEGKSVIWSAKPPAWSGSDSPWKRAAADTSMIDSQIRSLQSSANQTNGPAMMFYAVSHEPHDNASDTSKGWDNGSANRKCGSTTSPSGSDASHDPCLGTSAEFKDLYHQMRLRQQVACTSTGGTTGGVYGHPCKKVLITYIGVNSNMTPGAVVGDDDVMRPNSDDFDVLGGDVFNWGCFRKSTGTCSSSNHEWKSFETLIDDPSSSANNEFLDLAAALSKPAIIAELGSHPGCNGSGDTAFKCNGSSTVFSRQDWFKQMFDYLKFDLEANQYLLGYAYFHEFQSHDWRFIDTTAGGDVDNRGFDWYKILIASPLYRSTAASYDYELRTPVPDLSVYRAALSKVETPYSEKARAEQRKRHGASGWAPRDVGFAAWRTTYNSNPVNKFKMTFQYHQTHHQIQSDNYMQTLEIAADIPCVNGQSPWGYDWNSAPGDRGYEPGLWATNIPAAALPHEDNMFFESKNVTPWNYFANDDCGSDGKISVGFGVGNVSALSNNTEYWVEFGTYCQTSCTSNYSVTLKAQVGTMYDIRLPMLPHDNADCKWNPTELDNWNNAIWGRESRYQASWCVNNDYEYTYVFQEQNILATGSSTVQHVVADWLVNQGMAESPDLNGYTFWHQWGSPVNRVKYCNGTGYDESCFVQFNSGNGNGEVSIQQDVTYPGGAAGLKKYTAEAMVRCPTSNAGNCPITIGVWGIGGPNGNEGQGMSQTLPNNGHWYLCRTDDDHPDPDPDAGFQYSHNTLRWEVYNKGGFGINLDVDFTFLGARSRELDPRIEGKVPGKIPLVGGFKFDNDLGDVGDIMDDTPNGCYQATGPGAVVN